MSFESQKVTDFPGMAESEPASQRRRNGHSASVQSIPEVRVTKDTLAKTIAFRVTRSKALPKVAPSYYQGGRLETFFISRDNLADFAEGAVMPEGYSWNDPYQITYEEAIGPHPSWWSEACGCYIDSFDVLDTGTNCKLASLATVYPHTDSTVRLADNKVWLKANSIDMGNTIERFIPASQKHGVPGKGWWSTIKWDESSQLVKQPRAHDEKLPQNAKNTGLSGDNQHPSRTTDIVRELNRLLARPEGDSADEHAGASTCMHFFASGTRCSAETHAVCTSLRASHALRGRLLKVNAHRLNRAREDTRAARNSRGPSAISEVMAHTRPAHLCEDRERRRSCLRGDSRTNCARFGVARAPGTGHDFCKACEDLRAARNSQPKRRFAGERSRATCAPLRRSRAPAVLAHNLCAIQCRTPRVARTDAAGLSERLDSVHGTRNAHNGTESSPRKTRVCGRRRISTIRRCVDPHGEWSGHVDAPECASRRMEPKLLVPALCWGMCATGLIESSRAGKTVKQRQELDPNRMEHNHAGGFHGSPRAKVLTDAPNAERRVLHSGKTTHPDAIDGGSNRLKTS
ncbi:hypothetical protein B0H19DRAFT_1067405 [Mycena capillaripes]|nr:hypothetical protein B0H19DRAFT_1067405 [Mycena capillaripes]